MANPITTEQITVYEDRFRAASNNDLIATYDRLALARRSKDKVTKANAVALLGVLIPVFRQRKLGGGQWTRETAPYTTTPNY